MSEFDIITRYFTAQTKHRPDVLTGIGDDAAIVKPLAGHDLAITTDTLVSGVHFPESTLPYDIGFKSLAVNLSDLAAMGAKPAWVTMALTMPHQDNDFIQAFCNGFFNLANRYSVQLIGGDLTHGPLSITIQALGFTLPQQAVLRSQAKPGDLIYVTGTLGDAGLALKHIQQGLAINPEYHNEILQRLQRPEPRITTGECLPTLASAAIDISDGLAADLGHILKASNVGAMINVEQLPLSLALTNTLAAEQAIELALTAGDDYELCFTVSAQKRAELEKQLSALSCRHTCIGEITAKPGLTLRYKNGSKYHGAVLGYQHF
jgi:thiamine-monophosphate kinase